jgi:hypothetical protein
MRKGGKVLRHPFLENNSKTNKQGKSTHNEPKMADYVGKNPR